MHNPDPIEPTEADNHEEKSLLDDVVDALGFFDGRYAREEVDYALDHRAIVTPKLLEILRDVLEHPERYAPDQHNIGHIYALMLLAHFREEAAHETILGLCRLPVGLLDDLFDEIVTEDLPSILLRTCGGSFDGIKALAMDGNVYEYCRGAATEAISLAACYGILPREEALSFLHTFLEDEVAVENGYVTTLAAGNICDIGPGESMERITNAFNKGYIDPAFTDFAWFEACAAKGSEDCMKDTLEQLGARSLDDVHAAMSWWACFNEAPDRYAGGSPARDKAKQKTRNNAKRKQSSASRKKNRR
jgi:hypothetical protein